MHIAVRAIVPDHAIPASELLKSLCVDKREPIIAEEADCPHLLLACCLIDAEVRCLRFANRVDGGLVEGTVGISVFMGGGDYVHVAPEVMGKVVVDGFAEVKVLELREGLQGRHCDDVDAEDLGQAMVVHVKWVLRCEEPSSVRVKCACVLDDIDVGGRPASGDVAHYHLLEKRPVSREANVEAGVLRDMGVWGRVP